MVVKICDDYWRKKDRYRISQNNEVGGSAYNIKTEIALDIVNSSHRIHSLRRCVYGRNFPCEITLLQWRGCTARNVRKKGTGRPHKK